MSSARIMIAGTGSGCGKTSVTLGLLAALRGRGLRVSACKCGPDYIDPAFHREVLGAPSRNLDLFLCGEAAVRALLAESLCAADLTVIEGVMGYYDGMGGTTEASSHQLADVTATPVVLVVDCRGKALSLAAEVRGFQSFLPNNIAGVILNRATARSYPMLRAAVEEHCGVAVLGYLPRLPGAALESRHLGLVTAAEVADLRQRVELLAEQLRETVDLDALLALAQSAPALEAETPDIQSGEPVRIAVAADDAFCFTYPDNLTLLERMGAEVVPFSPLADRELPADIHGLILSGGYPELYAGRLSANGGMLADLRSAVEVGIPTIAECGGFMTLCRQITTADGATYTMAGALDAAVTMTGRLSRFGYITLTAERDNLLCGLGEALPAHEFHYSEADNPGGAFRAAKRGGAEWDCVHATETLYAGYPHLHLWGCPGAARRFLDRCVQYKRATYDPHNKEAGT